MDSEVCVINPGNPTNDFGNSFSSSTFSVKRTKKVVRAKKKNQSERKNLVRNTWGIAVLFGVLIEQSAPESTNRITLEMQADTARNDEPDSKRQSSVGWESDLTRD